MKRPLRYVPIRTSEISLAHVLVQPRAELVSTRYGFPLLSLRVHDHSPAIGHLVDNVGSSIIDAVLKVRSGLHAGSRLSR